MTAGGAWRRPRMKVYDYNQEFGGNYYQSIVFSLKSASGPKKLGARLPADWNE